MAAFDRHDALSALRAGLPGLTTALSAQPAPGSGPRDRDAERLQLKRMAEEFEALLMNEMLSGWRRSLISNDDDESSESLGLGGLSTMTDMVGTEFGRALSRAGGLGIADVLMRAFDRQQGLDEPAGAAAAPATPPPPAVAAAPPATRADRPPRGGAHESAPAEPSSAAAGPTAGQAPGPVTSGFGWRRDPFSGQPKFHAGLDVRMAYGQEVVSLADGTVSAAGPQGGYGLTVVVDHPDGRQTRYAHLSSIDVQVGDKVERGRPLARSGNSGRSTGPHLHVELIDQAGRPVDPAGLLKRGTPTADWMAYRSVESERPE